MILPTVLAAYAIALAVGAPLVWGSWASRAPRLGIAVLQALSLGALLALVLAAAAVVVPITSMPRELAALLDACAAAVRAAYATPAGGVAASVGLLVGLAVSVRVVGLVSAELLRARRARRHHQDLLGLVAVPHQEHRVSVVDAEVASAYCLPGRRGRVVVTSGALAALDRFQLAAVIAHERAHLHGHHHLLVGLANGLSRAFPRVPLYRLAQRETVRLVELMADDAATRSQERLTVAAALVTLAQGRAPAPALSAGGPGAVARVQRLLAPARPLGARATLAIAVLAASAVLAPAAAAAAPAVRAAALDYCPVTFD